MSNFKSVVSMWHHPSSIGHWNNKGMIHLCAGIRENPKGAFTLAV